MELVSKTIKKETSITPYSTLVSRYTKWFDDRYVNKKIDDLPEKKEDIVLIPGKIYTFSYDPITKDQMQFFSYMPINLILGYKISETGNIIPYGINLSFIPPSVRIKVLDAVVRVWGNNIIKNNEELIGKGLPTQEEIPMDYDASATSVNQLNRIKLMLSTAFRETEGREEPLYGSSFKPIDLNAQR